MNESFLSKLLNYYGLDKDEYLRLKSDVKESDLPDRKNFFGAQEAKEDIEKAIAQGEKILIYGDYDCDGIMATSIMVSALTSLGGDVGYYIPIRSKDGYGLTKDNVDNFLSSGYKQLICVDNGITLFDEVAYAKEKGMKVTIIDHHTPSDELPKADHIIHRKYSSYAPLNMSAGATSFIFSIGLLNRVDPYLSALGAISTISDMMELKCYNRAIVKYGLESIAVNHYLNIELLAKKRNGINEDDIAMSIAPKVNAIGRLIDDSSIFEIVRYFIEKDSDFTVKLASWIENVNQKRKDLTKLASSTFADFDLEAPAIVEVLDVNEGLCGLIANRVMMESDKPCVILTHDPNRKNVLVGSVRSKEGFDVNKALEGSRDLLLTYGGHAKAGGLTLFEKDFATFKERFIYAAKKHTFVEIKEETIPLEKEEINLENIALVDSLRPYGQGFKKPLFKLGPLKENEVAFSRDRKHLLCRLDSGASIVYFNYPSDLFANDSAYLLGDLSINEFNGRKSPQFVAHSFIKN
jgi:single-stranded-DNA-specific exonuclease